MPKSAFQECLDFLEARKPKLAQRELHSDAETRGQPPMNTPAHEEPAILHGFRIKLTRKQRDELRSIWTQHSKANSAIIMQPLLHWGPFMVENVEANCAIVNAACFAVLNAALKSAQKPKQQ